MCPFCLQQRLSWLDWFPWASYFKLNKVVSCFHGTFNSLAEDTLGNSSECLLGGVFEKAGVLYRSSADDHSFL